MITNTFQWKFFWWKGIYLKLMFFVCLYVSTATKEGPNRLDCAWLTLLKEMTRSRMNGYSSLSLKSELLETRSFFFRVSRKKRNKKRLIRKVKNCNFVGTMILLKREIAKKMGHRKTQNFLNATMYGARLVPHIRSSVLDQPFSLLFYFEYWTLNEIKMEFVFTIENKNVVENVIKGTWKMKN